MTTAARTKLAIRHIPPAITEDEFQELVKDWLKYTNYFSFSAGKVVKDAYGKVLARDQPSYGCAHLNFSHPKQCAAFYREFNGKTMNDSCGFKAKLLVDFALYQEVPDYGTQRPNPLCGTYKSSVYYQEFLKKYPEFDQKVPAAPAEEIDLDNPDNEAILAEARKAASQSGMDKVIDEAARIDLSTLAPKFSEIMRPESPKTVITPLTEYVIKKLKKGRDYKMPARKDRQRDQPPKPKQPEQTRVPVKEFKTRNSQVPSEQSTIAKPESIDKPVEKSTDKPVERKSAKKQFKTESRSKAEPVARIESVAAESTIKAEPKPKQNPPKKQQKPPKPPKTEAEQPEKATPKAAPRILARKPQSEALKLEVVHQAEVKPVEPVQAQSNPKQPPVKKFAKKSSIKAMLDGEQIEKPPQQPPRPKPQFTTAAKKRSTEAPEQKE